MTRHPRSVLAALSVVIAACGGTPAATSVPVSTAASAPAPPSPTVAPDPTPSVRIIDGLSVTTANLGASVAPIDVVSAFGSLWVAAHRQGSVIRLDPVTLKPIATIKVSSGPGWFAVTDEAVWVNSQMGRGLTPIDPATNTAGERAGTYPTCGGPVVAAGSIWQMACDSGQIIRVDLATGKAADIYADEYAGVGLVGDTLVAVGPNAISRVDPETSTLEEIAPGVDGFPIGYDDRSVWLAAPGEVQRISIVDGSVLATLPIGGDTTVTLAGDRAWVTQFGLATHEVDALTNTLLRTIHLDRPAVAREIDGTVWFTSFDSNSLGRFQP
jgi:hypothetical protein